MARTGVGKNSIVALALLPFAAWIAAFLLLPALSMIVTSFQNENGHGVTLDHYIRAFRSPVYSLGMVNSIKISVLSSLVGLAAGLLCAQSFRKLPPRIRDIFLNLSNIMTNFSGVPLAFAFIVLIGTSGMITLLLKHWGMTWLVINLYSWNGLLCVYIYFQIPLAILLLYPALYGLKEEWKEAASILGAGDRQFWRHIGVPILLPSLLGTFNILFASAMGAYATAYALFTSSASLLPIQIAGLVSGDIFPRHELGSALAVILTLLMIVPMFINQWMSKAVSRRRP